MHIVKLGGSLYHTSELKYWLTLLSEYSLHESVVIVPGGGPFADIVRQAQTLHEFDDQHAHHMALLAMTQFGLLLHALLPSATTIRMPAESSPHNQLAIWLPDDNMLHIDALKQSWDITSDSLALWFAQQLPQSKLSLVKHVTVASGDIKQLSNIGVIDQGFQALYQQHPLKAQVIHYQQLNHFPNKGISLR